MRLVVVRGIRRNCTRRNKGSHLRFEGAPALHRHDALAGRLYCPDKMVRMSNVTPVVIAVLVAELVPAATFGFAEERVARALARLPLAMRVVLPALLVGPYVVIAATQHIFRWQWFALYAVLPVAMAWLLAQAAERKMK